MIVSLSKFLISDRIPEKNGLELFINNVDESSLNHLKVGDLWTKTVLSIYDQTCL